MNQQQVHSFTNAPSVNGKCNILYNTIVAALCCSALVKNFDGLYKKLLTLVQRGRIKCIEHMNKYEAATETVH